MSSPHKPYTNKDKWIVSIISGLLFLLIASPFLYKIVNSLSEGLLNLRMADKNGCPTILGLIIHAVIFTLVIRLLMR